MRDRNGSGRERSEKRDDAAVAVPAIATGSSVTCIRSLGRLGVRPLAVGDPDAAAARSRYCAGTETAPSPSEDLRGYRDALLAVARRPAVETVVPLREPDVYVLAKYRDRFAEYVSTPWPDFETVQSVQDRYELLDRAESLDLSVPETRLLGDWTHADETTVVKSRYSVLETDNGTSYPGVTVVTPDEELDAERRVEEMGHVPLAQEFVPGNFECGFFALFDHGEPVATFQHRRVRSYSYDGGASVFRKSTRIPAIADAGTRLLSDLEWHGPAMVEFKRDPRDGTYKLMEINPRFWGSLALAVAAGVDFPALYYRLATGDVPDRPAYDTGVGCHILRGEASYLYSLLRDDYDHVEKPSFLGELGSVGRSVLTDRHFDYLDVGDPLPFVYDAIETV